MKEITILNEAPAILTKDNEWVRDYARDIMLVSGAIILLPEDAVLVDLPEQKEN